MIHTSATAFKYAAEQAQHWANELGHDLGSTERNAYQFTKSVLHALRLPPKEMADLSAQLPTLTRGIYFEGWEPSDEPLWAREKSDFVVCVSRRFRQEPDIDTAKVISAVFELLDRHVSHGEIARVRNSMRKSFRNLCPAG
ncbi:MULTISPECIES: DUF2267 domain-containing protein [unclassified Mesorhizobium]|uniref:DUF2267 domain-containing protein n=1 Tax=unclassified Mesorhizobium TaxID=325217 RepID=UPI003014F581